MRCSGYGSGAHGDKRDVGGGHGSLAVKFSYQHSHSTRQASHKAPRRRIVDPGNLKPLTKLRFTGGYARLVRPAGGSNPGSIPDLVGAAREGSRVTDHLANTSSVQPSALCQCPTLRIRTC